MTEQEHQILSWHLRAAQLADHKAMGTRFRACVDPVAGDETIAFDSRGEARRWLASHRRNLVRLVELASEREWHFETWALAEALWAYFTANGSHEDAERCYRLAVAAAAAQADAVAQIRMMLMLAKTLTDARAFADAESTLDEARALADAGLDDPDPATALPMLGLAGTGLELTGRLHLRRGAFELAQSWFERALVNAQEQDRRSVDGNPRVLALQHRFLARCRAGLGDVEGARDHFALAGELFRQAEDARTGLILGIELALFDVANGMPEARDRAVEVLQLAEDDSLTLSAAQGWHELGRLVEEPQRLTFLRHALKLYKSIRDPDADEVQKLLEAS